MPQIPIITTYTPAPPVLTREYDTVAWDDRGSCCRRVSVCIEEAIRITVNGRPLVTMTMSPAEIAEFVCGYLISEGLVPDISHIQKIHIEKGEVLVTIPGFDDSLLSNERVIRTSGGMGLVSAKAERKPSSAREVRVRRETIFSSISRLNDHAVLWKETGGTHCTVLFDCDGEVIAHAEDMGRHNSLDKVIGKAHLAGTDTSRTFIVCSGRMPAGMVSKIWHAGIPIIVTNNAPSAPGIDLARNLGLTLAGFVRPPRMIVYSGLERILF